MRLIWGEKTGLRRFEERMTDAEMNKLYEWSRDEEILRWSGGSPTDLSETEFREHLHAERLYGPTNRRAFLIFAGEPLTLIGRLGIFGIDWDKEQGELGIVIGDKQYWGHGYGRDAVSTVIHHLFTTSSLERIYLYTFVENLRAQKSFAAAGFRVVDHGRRFTPEVGEFEGVQMEFTRDDFVQELIRKHASLQRREE
jgi:ribosomal-protein-alanine N-acetyltransferase